MGRFIKQLAFTFFLLGLTLLLLSPFGLALSFLPGFNGPGEWWDWAAHPAFQDLWSELRLVWGAPIEAESTGVIESR